MGRQIQFGSIEVVKAKMLEEAYQKLSVLFSFIDRYVDHIHYYVDVSSVIGTDGEPVILVAYNCERSSDELIVSVREGKSYPYYYCSGQGWDNVIYEGAAVDDLVIAVRNTVDDAGVPF